MFIKIRVRNRNLGNIEENVIINTDHIVSIHKEAGKNPHYEIFMDGQRQGTGVGLEPINSLQPIVYYVDEDVVKDIYVVCNISVQNQFFLVHGVNQAPDALPDF